MPEVSVIVPIYNSEDYLETCLHSLAVQSFPDFEVILTDDGSRDAGREICMEYCARFPAFRYFRKENGGLSDARNFGITKAKGRWLAFVDSDDYVERNFIRMLYTAAAKEGVSLVCCGYYEERENGRKKIGYPVSGRIEGREFFESILSGEEIGNFICNKLFAAELFEGIEFPRGKRYEDMRTLYKLADRCKGMAVVREPLYHYVYRRTSLSHGYGEENGRELMEACKELCGYICGKYPDLDRQCDRYLFLEHVYNLNTLSKAGIFPGTEVWDASAKYLRMHREQRGYLDTRHRLSAELLMRVPGIYSRLLYWKHRMQTKEVRGKQGAAYAGSGKAAQAVSRELPLISIIIPVYRVEKWLDRCLLSVIRQSYQNIEILLIDDGSPDRCGEMCEEWAGKDARIRVIHKQNAGLGMARNTGVEAARGDYIAFVDSDDYISRDMIRTLYHTIKGSGADACYGGCIDVDENGGMRCGTPPKKRIYTGERELLAFIKEVIGNKPSKSGNCFTGMSAWGNLYAASLFREKGIRFCKEQKVLCEDLFFNIAVCRQANRVIIAPYCMYYYCANEGTLTKAYRPGRFEAAKNMRRLLGKEFRQEMKSDRDLALRIDRNYLDNLILCLKLEILYRKQNGKRRCMGQLKHMINDRTTQSVLARYPVGRMEKKQRLLFMMIKLRMMAPVLWMFRIRYHI